MKSPYENPYKGWFQQLVRGEIEAAGYEPVSLWLIPILLRSRKQYYDDAVAATRKHIEYCWQTCKSIYPSIVDFEQSDSGQHIWERESPLWWGLNDIIGWIDVRVCVRNREFQISLFLPTKRISKKLRTKVYFCHLRQIIAIPDRSTNEELRTALIQCVEKVAADKRLRGRYIDLACWRRIVCHLDLIGIIRETAEADTELLLKEQKKKSGDTIPRK